MRSCIGRSSCSKVGRGSVPRAFGSLRLSEPRSLAGEIHFKRQAPALPKSTSSGSPRSAKIDLQWQPKAILGLQWHVRLLIKKTIKPSTWGLPKSASDGAGKNAIGGHFWRGTMPSEVDFGFSQPPELDFGAGQPAIEPRFCLLRIGLIGRYKDVAVGVVRKIDGECAVAKHLVKNCIYVAGGNIDHWVGHGAVPAHVGKSEFKLGGVQPRVATGGSVTPRRRRR